MCSLREVAVAGVDDCETEAGDRTDEDREWRRGVWSGKRNKDW